MGRTSGEMYRSAENVLDDARIELELKFNSAIANVGLETIKIAVSEPTGTTTLFRGGGQLPQSPKPTTGSWAHYLSLTSLKSGGAKQVTRDGRLWLSVETLYISHQVALSSLIDFQPITDMYDGTTRFPPGGTPSVVWEKIVIVNGSILEEYINDIRDNIEKELKKAQQKTESLYNFLFGNVSKNVEGFFNAQTKAINDIFNEFDTDLLAVEEDIDNKITPELARINRELVKSTTAITDNYVEFKDKIEPRKLAVTNEILNSVTDMSNVLDSRISKTAGNLTKQFTTQSALVQTNLDTAQTDINKKLDNQILSLATLTQAVIPNLNSRVSTIEQTLPTLVIRVGVTNSVEISNITKTIQNDIDDNNDKIKKLDDDITKDIKGIRETIQSFIDNPSLLLPAINSFMGNKQSSTFVLINQIIRKALGG